MKRYSDMTTISTASGGVGQTLATAKPFEVGPSGLVSVHVVVDGGSKRNTPTDAPVGVLHMYASSDSGAPQSAGPDSMGFDLVDTADSDLAAVSPAGNVFVGAWKSFECAPGRYVKFVYTYTSGGGTGSRIRLGVVCS